MLASSRRGWTILATSFVTLAVIYGIWYSYSVFLVALVREFGWSRSLVAGAFSVFSMVHGGPRRPRLLQGSPLSPCLLVSLSSFLPIDQSTN